MAENKKKIIVYADWIDGFEYLTDEEAGKLIKHFFRYVNDQNPVLEDRVLVSSWIPIEKTLKRDLDKWEEGAGNRKNKARLAGKASAESRQLKATQSNYRVQKELGSTQSTVSVSVKDSVNDNVKDNASIYINYSDFKLSESETEQISKVHSLNSLDKPLEDFKYLNDEVKSRSEIMKHFKNWMKHNGDSYKERKRSIL